MRNGIACLIGALAWGTIACDDGGGSTPEPDFTIELDEGPRDAAEWDAGDGEIVVDRRDQGPPREMGVEACLERGGALVMSFESEALPGAEAVRGDLDPDGDGRPALVVTHRDPSGMRLALYDGASFEARGQAVIPMADAVDLMPEAWPQAGLLTPMPGGLYGAWARGEAGHRLYAIRADGFEASAPIPLPGPATRVQFARVGNRALALVEGSDRGCAIYDLLGGAELMSQGQCTVRPAWDVNGDDVPELVRSGGDGTALLDGTSLEVVAQIPERLVLGPGPIDARGRGPEVIGVGPGEGGWLLYHLDPVDLSGGEPVGISGDFTRAEVHQFGAAQRVLLEEERLSLKYLRIIEPNAMARRRAELGSYRQLWWRVGPDADADGAPDIHLVGGSTEDGSNTAVSFFSLEDGRPAYTIEAERSARFLPAFGTSDKGQAPQDLDGCEGSELVALRQGALSGAGTRPTRIHIYDAGGRVIWRSDPYTTSAHALAVADLDGEGPYELVELRADDGDAKLRIYRAAQ